MRKKTHHDAEAMSGLSLAVEELSEQIPAAESCSWTSENVVCGAGDLHAPSRQTNEEGEGEVLAGRGTCHSAQKGHSLGRKLSLQMCPLAGLLRAPMDTKALMEDVYPISHGTPKTPPMCPKITQSPAIMVEQILCGQKIDKPSLGIGVLGLLTVVCTSSLLGTRSIEGIGTTGSCAAGVGTSHWYWLMPFLHCWRHWLQKVE